MSEFCIVEHPLDRTVKHVFDLGTQYPAIVKENEIGTECLLQCRQLLGSFHLATPRDRDGVKCAVDGPSATAASGRENSLFPNPRLPQGVPSVVDEKSVTGHSVYAVVPQALILDYGNILGQPQD